MTAKGIQNDDLPYVYEIADATSRAAQRRYLWTLRADIASLVLAALCGAWPSGPESVSRVKFGLVAMLFVAGFVLTLVLALKNFDKKWYGGRAIAESIKTVAWKYAMRADPFHTTNEADAIQQFTIMVSQVGQQTAVLSIEDEVSHTPRPTIPLRMRELRASSLQQRRDTYLQCRIEEQRRWYHGRARWNAQRERAHFAGILCLQLAAIGYAILMVAEPNLSFNATGLLTTAAAGVLVWMQAKQYQELAQAYTLTAIELGMVAEQAPQIQEESQLAQFVSDAENAISREHTMWIARRDYMPRLARI